MTDQGEYFRLRDDATTDPEYQPRYLHVMRDLLGLNLEPGRILHGGTGSFYPGGFGVPHTDYFAITLGPDYHPTKWLQFRPEIRYDHATHDNFGSNFDKKDQLSIAVETLFKF